MMVAHLKRWSKQTQRLEAHERRTILHKIDRKQKLLIDKNILQCSKALVLEFLSVFMKKVKEKIYIYISSDKKSPCV